LIYKSIYILPKFKASKKVSKKFKALQAKFELEKFSLDITEIGLDDLPENDTLIKVFYSSLNYKDSMAIDSNRGKILRNFPMSPGIDLSGIIEHTKSNIFSKGDKVIVTGWGMGEKFSGGFSQYARVNSDYIVRNPDNLSLKNSMCLGTAGLTAMLAIMELESLGINNSKGEILITGATGGVGSLSIILLSKMGYDVIALTGKKKSESLLKELGAKKIIHRDEILNMNKPLNSPKWIGAIDTVGGDILANLMSATGYGGIIASCGNASGNNVPTTVLPFILRKIKLIGIDSVYASLEQRREAWVRLSTLIIDNDLNKISTEITLSELKSSAQKMISGKTVGRIIVNINNS